MQQSQPGNNAETYERYFVPAMFLPWARILLRHAALQSGERVLDVACGTGVVARQAAPSVGADGRVVGVDMNLAMLAVAQALPAPPGAKINWREGDATALPFPDGAFDVVLCQHGLPFFPDRVHAVQEMRRVLAPKGRTLTIVLQALSRHPVFETLMESVARHLALPTSLVTIPFALHNAKELRSLFIAAGFQKVDILPASTTVRFREAEHFVPLAVASSAAAVPAFAQLEASDRKALFERVRGETEPIIRRYIDGDVVSFPMYAHVAVAFTSPLV